MMISSVKPFARVFILIVAALLFVCNALTLATWEQQTDPSTTGTLGGKFIAGDVDKRLRIASLVPGGALANAGAKVGDRIEFAHIGTRLRQNRSVNEVIELTLHSETGARRVFLRPQAKGETAPVSILPSVLNLINAFLGIALAVAICIRRGKEGAMLAFAMAMLMNSPTTFTALLPAGALQDTVAVFLRPLDFTGGYLFFLLFVLKFPAENALFKHPVVRFAFYGYAIVLLLSAILWMGAREGALYVPPALHAWATLSSQSLAIASALLSVGILAYSWYVNHGALRSRIGWILLSIGATYLMWAGVNFVEAVGMQIANVDFVINVVYFFALMGFAYALLRHQIFDFSFAVNRTLVFAVTSLLLFAAFWMIEQLVHKLVHFEAADKNAMLGGAIAFGLFFTFNRLHHRVDHWIEHLFFRQWRAKESALQQFVAKAAHFVEIDALLAGFGTALDRFTDNAGNAVYLASPNGEYRLAHSTFASALMHAPATLAVDDDIAVSLRSERRAISLDENHGAWPGANAFPMLHGQELVGIYLVNAPSEGQAYRPDQQEMLELSVSRIGLELSRLQAKALATKLQRIELEQDRWLQELDAVKQDRATLRLALSKIPALQKGSALP